MILTCALFHLVPWGVFRVSPLRTKKSTDVCEVCRSRLDSHRRCVRSATKGKHKKEKRLAISLGVISAANLILLPSSYLHLSDASNLTCTGNPPHNMRTCAATSLSPHL